MRVGLCHHSLLAIEWEGRLWLSSAMLGDFTPQAGLSHDELQSLVELSDTRQRVPLAGHAPARLRMSPSGMPTLGQRIR